MRNAPAANHLTNAPALVNLAFIIAKQFASIGGRNMSKKSNIRLAIVFSAMLSAISAGAKDTVKVAFIGPLTGGLSANGLGGRNSADLAVRIRNADPKAKYSYEMLVLDDECKPNIGVQVATKAAADKSVIAGVTHYCSAEYFPIVRCG